ncbi:symmetrical bis(5'-nucleosyl)-tetraphosphatase [Zymobacter palmae]|uniref:bis(5'-nucleosyl)-tetraphosphatase (symmetrical) n=1 Tax=Zymobacter palmae TaxID=33074 RepID=A0A348HGR9_9GAMM|nr:symmetrical bis(5'-nucleosyl)-tetraphosphatase [Zymobacter palmae]BBG30821.1 diadenosine tetraphosphatase [Zymobacter palmae]
MTESRRTIVIGDLHGCRATFERLLDAVAFDAVHDALWLVGDLINRGPDSMGCLRMARQLKARVVLGNHDLNLLAVSQGVVQPRKGDTLDAILDAPDCDEWIDWLRHQSLLVDGLIAGTRTVMTHAGLPPQWTLEQARSRAREIERALQSDDWAMFISHMHGNAPARFDESLTGWDRLRAITNTLTRMRFITADGTLDFNAKASAQNAPAGLAPWFAYPRRDDLRIVFGHWAALQGHADGAAIDVIATDSGCVWGNALAAVVLETGQRVEVPSELR